MTSLLIKATYVGQSLEYMVALFKRFHYNIPYSQTSKLSMGVIFKT